MRHVRRCVRSQGEEAAADLRDRVHEQLDALGELELSIEDAVKSGLVAATDAPALKQIAGKRKGGDEIGGALYHSPARAMPICSPICPNPNPHNPNTPPSPNPTTTYSLLTYSTRHATQRRYL